MEEKIELYRLQAKKLRSHPDFLNDFSATLNWEEGKGVSVVHSGLDDKTITAVFMAARPFLMKERINFEQLCRNILESDCSEEMKNDTRQALDAWGFLIHPKKDQQIMQINEKDISYRENFLYWMNEEHFHPEEYKIDGSRGLSSIKQSSILEWFSKPHMVDFLQKAVQLILWLDIRVLSKLEKQ